MHTCINGDGHRRCECQDGYHLSGDGLNCIDNDECTFQNGNCENVCVNTIGSYYCGCREGLRLDQDGKTCIGECFYGI